ncbi:hypothetical protein L083_1263 [Actinoplanes sp. N902-109]|nr:hypothetical protein L083_1263 [Actinoplanes sp. N902-109]
MAKAEKGVASDLFTTRTPNCSYARLRGRRCAVVRDPDGNHVDLYAPLSRPTSSRRVPPETGTTRTSPGTGVRRLSE